MEIDNFNHNLQDMDLNGDHNLQPDFDSSQNLQDQNNLLDSQTMDISHHPTDPSEMDFNQSSPLSNPLEQDNFNNSQVDYSQTISEQQHLNLSQSSAMHDAFNNQHLDVHNAYESQNLLENQNMGDSYSQAHNFHQDHDLQRSGTSASELLQDAQDYQSQANGYKKDYEIHSNYVKEDRKNGHRDQADSYEEQAKTDIEQYEEYTKKAEEARNKANEML